MLAKVCLPLPRTQSATVHVAAAKCMTGKPKTICPAYFQLDHSYWASSSKISAYVCSSAAQCIYGTCCMHKLGTQWFIVWRRHRLLLARLRVTADTRIPHSASEVMFQSRKTNPSGLADNYVKLVDEMMLNGLELSRPDGSYIRIFWKI